MTTQPTEAATGATRIVITGNLLCVGFQSVGPAMAPNERVAVFAQCDDEGPILSAILSAKIIIPVDETQARTLGALLYRDFTITIVHGSDGPGEGRK